MKVELDLKPAITNVVCDIIDGVASARKKHPAPYHSPHEGMSILREEVDELWDEIKSDAPVERMREEAMHVAVVAVRFILDIC